MGGPPHLPTLLTIAGSVMSGGHRPVFAPPPWTRLPAGGSFGLLSQFKLYLSSTVHRAMQHLVKISFQVRFIMPSMKRVVSPSRRPGALNGTRDPASGARPSVPHRLWTEQQQCRQALGSS